MSTGAWRPKSWRGAMRWRPSGGRRSALRLRNALRLHLDTTRRKPRPGRRHRRSTPLRLLPLPMCGANRSPTPLRNARVARGRTCDTTRGLVKSPIGRRRAIERHKRHACVHRSAPQGTSGRSASSECLPRPLPLRRRSWCIRIRRSANASCFCAATTPARSARQTFARSRASPKRRSMLHWRTPRPTADGGKSAQRRWRGEVIFESGSILQNRRG